MKKLLIIVLAVLMAASLAVFVACGDDSSSSHTSKTNTDAPKIEVTETGFSFSHSESKAIFNYKIEGGDWKEGNAIEFNEEPGKHSFSVVAYVGVTKIRTKEAKYEYETKESAIKIVAAEDKKSFTVGYEGAKLFIKEGEEFVATTVTEYSDLETGTYAFKTVGGFVEAGKVLTIPACCSRT